MSLVKHEDKSGARSLHWHVARSATQFAILSIIPKCLSIAKDVVIASTFGTSAALDAYLMAFVLIGLPVAIFVVSQQTALIPLLVKQRELNCRSGSLLRSAITQTIVVLILCLPFWLSILPLGLSALYPNVSAEARTLLFYACLGLIPYYFLNGINILAYGALQARKIFWPNAVLPGIFPIAIVISLLISDEADIDALLWGTCAGSVTETAVLLCLLIRWGLLEGNVSPREQSTLLLQRTIPLVIGSLVASFLPVIENAIAFSLGNGGVSTLAYGYKVPAALSSVLVTAVGITVLPHFASLVAADRWAACKALYRRIILAAGIMGGILTISTLVISEEIVSLLFQRGMFTPQDTMEVARVQQVYLLQLPFLLMNMVAIRLLAALGHNGAISFIALLQVLVAGICGLWFSAKFGVQGISMGTSLSSGFAFVVLWFMVRVVISRKRTA